jgi:T5SS/PEP-CTERM-associated repeat protein/autotransporter-associated beta strand protein
MRVGGGGSAPEFLLDGAGALQISSGGFVGVDHLQVRRFGSAQVDNGSSTVSGLTVYGNSYRPTPLKPNYGGPLTIGNSTSGRMVLQRGGTISNGLGTIGANVGSVGSVLVDGADSTWINLDQVSVGLSGAGTLEIRNGGTLKSVRGFAGANGFSSGIITVSDPGSTWNASGSLFIGNSGSGSLQVLNGGVVTTTGNSHLGFTNGATGDVNVSGPGSTLNIAALLNIGGDSAAARGNGSVRIADGAAVNVGGGVNLYGAGHLDLVNAVQLTGDLNSFGGRIRTTGNTTLANTVHLNAGGVLVETNNPDGNATFNGNIDGAGGLAKVGGFGLTGNGALTLSGANTYTGPTTVDVGTLLVNGTSTSATTVRTGSLGGMGAISGVVTIGNNSGADDAIIAPGASVGTLATGNLALLGDAVFSCELDSASRLADQINVAGTVSLNPGALFTVADLASSKLPSGQTFTVIKNDGGDAIAGTFSNLAEGAMFISGANAFQATYRGGSGNDLVLNVLPTAFLEADFDQDGVVDGDDLAAWETGFGKSIDATHMLGDADSDQDVDGADFLAWQRQLGRVDTAVEANNVAFAVQWSPVPEPLDWTLAATSAVTLLEIRGRKINRARQQRITS